MDHCQMMKLLERHESLNTEKQPETFHLHHCGCEKCSRFFSEILFTTENRNTGTYITKLYVIPYFLR